MKSQVTTHFVTFLATMTSELVYGFCTLDELFAVDWDGLADENESDHRDVVDTLELLCGWLIKFSMTPGVSLTEFRMLFRVH